MDVQGAESRVLAGAAKAIEEARITVIYTEVLVEATYKGQQSDGDLFKTFSNYGYELFNLTVFPNQPENCCNLTRYFARLKRSQISRPEHTKR
jgi:hypothetical protein